MYTFQIDICPWLWECCQLLEGCNYGQIILFFWGGGGGFVAIFYSLQKEFGRYDKRLHLWITLNEHTCPTFAEKIGQLFENSMEIPHVEWKAGGSKGSNDLDIICSIFNKPAYKMRIFCQVQSPPPPLYAFVCISVDPPPP